MKRITTNRIYRFLLVALCLLLVPALTIAVSRELSKDDLEKLSSDAFSATETSSVPDDVIFVAPEGSVHDYYLDLSTHDPAVGYIEEYHTKVKVTFCDNGDVYMSNMLHRNSLKGLMKGKLDRERGAISFSNKLIVGWGANQKKYYYLRACDRNGTLTNDEEFKFFIDKKTGVISGDKNLYLALYYGDDTSEFYAIAGNFQYTPTEIVDKKVDSYNFGYTKADDAGTVLSSKVKGYFEGSNFYVKGLNPKYSEAWMKGSLTSESRMKFSSRQMAYVMKNDDPIVMMAVSRDESGKYAFLDGFELQYDKTTESISGLTGEDVLMANVYLNEDQTTEVYQIYNNLDLKFNPLKPATPKDPEFYSFSAGDREFVFTLPSEDIDGGALDTDYMTFRVFVDGKPYTFTKEDYPKLKSDDPLLDIPFAFHDYNTIYKSGFKRYVYFNEIPQETETLGVEVKYEIKGVVNKSKQLVYNIKTGTSGYMADDIESKAVFLFPSKAQTKASIYVELMNPDQKVILVDWGEGAGAEEATLDQNGYINHTFSESVEGYHTMTLDASDVKALKDGDYDALPIGVQEMNAPEMTSFAFSSSMTATPDIDFSHLPKLQYVSFNAISSFIAPDSLVSFAMYRSMGTNAPYLTSIDLSRAKKLKTLQIQQSSHKLKEIDLSQNKELKTLMLSGSTNPSMKPTLTTIRGIKDLKKLTYCNLEYNALDFHNLLSSQPNLNPQIFQYDHQRFVIPKDKIGVAKVDLSYLYEISDGVVDGTHNSVYEWYFAPATVFDFLEEPIDPSYYDEDNGVFTFKSGAFGSGVTRAKLVCKVSNDAYPSYTNSYSSPIIVSLVDDNHCVFVSDGAYATWVEPSYEIYVEKEQNGQWILDKKIDNGSPVEPGSHVAVKASWDYEMIIDNWTINEEVVTETVVGEERPFRGATLRFVMPERGAVEIVPNFTQIVVSWRIIVPDGVPEEELSQFAVGVTKSQDGKVEHVYGQRVGMLYGSDVSCSDALFTFQASYPKGYKVEKWYVDGTKMETTEDIMTYQTDPYAYSLKVDVKFQPLIGRYTVSLFADPYEYAEESSLQVKASDGTFEDFSSGWVTEGSVVRAYVKPKTLCKVDKFVVNGEDYLGEVVDAGSQGQYIELTIREDTQIVAKMRHEHETITFAPQGDNAQMAKAELTVVKQEKNSAGNWVDGETVQSGDRLAPGQRVKVSASYDKRFVIKHWIVNDEVVADSSQKEEVSYANPIFLEMPEEGSLTITLELDRANMVSFLTIPEGVSDSDREEFALMLSIGGKILKGQEMSEDVMAYYVEGLEGKTVQCEAKALKGYIPEWRVDGNKLPDKDFAINAQASRNNLTIRLSFVKDTGTPCLSNATAVYEENGQIAIMAPARSSYSIYTVEGSLLTQGEVGDTQPLLVPVRSGVYIVIIEGVSYKVIVDMNL